MEEPEPTAEAILAAVGWKEVSVAFVRKMLASVREKGLLGGKGGQDAYPLTPKGEAAIASASGSA
jgi:hypothetical protein